MGPETADILKFLAFGLVWLFPIALVIAVLGFANADSKSHREELGPNVVVFPSPKHDTPETPVNWRARLKRLAFPGRNR